MRFPIRRAQTTAEVERRNKPEEDEESDDGVQVDNGVLVRQETLRHGEIAIGQYNLQRDANDSINETAELLLSTGTVLH